MFEASLQQVLDRWKQAFRQYDELKASAEPAVVRWEWASRERYTPLPFYYQRFPPRGRVLRGPPTEAGYFLHYGFDDQDRVRLHRLYGYTDMGGKQRLARHMAHGVETKDALAETFVNYQDTLTESIEFSVPPRIPLIVKQIFYERGQVVRFVSFRLNGYTPLYSQKGKNPDKLYEWLGYNGRFKTVEEYVYAGDRLVQIVGYSEIPGVAPYSYTDRLTYQAEGGLEQIERVYQDGTKQGLYRRRAKGETFQSIRESAVRLMIEAVVSRIRAANIRERLYCIELSYQAGEHHFPPYVIPGPESYRENLLASRGQAARYEIFSPVLQSNKWFLEITDPAAIEISERLEQEIRAGEKWETATSILREVAAALTRYDWTGIAETTPDFVVFAIDHEMEGDQLDRVLGASVSQAQIREWKSKGWL